MLRFCSKKCWLPLLTVVFLVSSLSVVGSFHEFERGDPPDNSGGAEADNDADDLCGNSLDDTGEECDWSTPQGGRECTAPEVCIDCLCKEVADVEPADGGCMMVGNARYRRPPPPKGTCVEVERLVGIPWFNGCGGSAMTIGISGSLACKKRFLFDKGEPVPCVCVRNRGDAECSRNCDNPYEVVLDQRFGNKVLCGTCEHPCIVKEEVSIPVGRPPPNWARQEGEKQGQTVSISFGEPCDGICCDPGFTCTGGSGTGSCKRCPGPKDFGGAESMGTGTELNPGAALITAGGPEGDMPTVACGSIACCSPNERCDRDAFEGRGECFVPCMPEFPNPCGPNCCAANEPCVDAVRGVCGAAGSGQWCDTSYPVGKFHVCYFDRERNSRRPLFQADDIPQTVGPKAVDAISHDFGRGDIARTGKKDEVSAVWRGTIHFRAGTYTFQTTSDDGISVDVEGFGKVINNLVAHPVTVDTSQPITLPTGPRKITVEWFEQGGEATISLLWFDAAAIGGGGPLTLNIDLDGDGRPDLNVDTDDDGLADVNIDIDDDQVADLSIDIDGDGVADVDIDVDGDRIADLNVDVDGDRVADLNIDTDGDLIADANIDRNGDGEADLKSVAQQWLRGAMRIAEVFAQLIRPPG